MGKFPSPEGQGELPIDPKTWFLEAGTEPRVLRAGGFNQGLPHLLCGAGGLWLLPGFSEQSGERREGQIPALLKLVASWLPWDHPA